MPGLAGGGLPDAEQIITADASGYLRALDEIIKKNQDWISKTREMQGEADKWQRTLDQFMRNMPQIAVKVDTDDGFERRVREMQAITDRLADTALKANEKMAQAWESHADSMHEVATSYEHAGDALGDFRQHVQDGGSQVRSLSQDMAELGRNAERTAAAIDRVKSSGWTPEALAAAAAANAARSAEASLPARYYAGIGGGRDEAALLQDAIKAVVSEQAVSAARLQRQLDIGPSVAKRIISELEAAGVVGPSQGRGRARDVLIWPEHPGGAGGLPPGVWAAHPGGIWGGGDGGGDRGGGGGFAAAAGGFFGAMKASTIFGNALPTLQVAHLVTMFTMEVLSTVIPAAVAAGAAGLVGLQAGQNLYQRGSSMWTAAEALGGTYGGQTLGSMVGLSSNLQKAQDLANGGVFGIGGALKDLVGQGGGAFTDMGVQTIAMINRGMTAMVMNNRMKQLTDAMSGGTGFLRMFGDIGSNIGDTLLNLAPNLPGMGPMLFEGLKGITGFMNMLTGGVPGPLLGGALAGEAGWRWGKLVLGGGNLPRFLGGGKVGGLAGLAERMGLGRVAGSGITAADAADIAALTGMDVAGSVGAGAAGTGLAGFLGVAGGPLTLGAALSAFALTQLAGTMPGVVGGRIAGLQGQINQSFGAMALTPITKALYQASQMNAWGGQQMPGGLAQSFYQNVPIMETPSQLARFGPAAGMGPAMAQVVPAFAQQLADLVTAGPSAIKALQGIGIKGASLTQAFEAMSMAMVSPQDFKGGQLDARGKKQLQEFAQTYRTASIGGQPGMASGLLMSGAADFIMSSSEMKSILQTNQALDSMTQIMTGGPAGQAALFGMLGGTPTTHTRAGLKIAAPYQPEMKQFARALSNVFSPQGAAAWNTFAGPQGLMAAQQANLDQARVYMTLGAISGQQGAQLGAFDLQQMLPMASKSPMAQYMLEQMAMQASIPGVSVGMKYKDLVRAITGTAPSSRGAMGILTQGTKAVADLPAIAAALITGDMGGPSALQSGLTAQMAQQSLALAAHPLLKGGGVNMPALQGLMSSMTAGGVKAGQMTVSVDAVLKNLHVPGNIISKINAEIGQGINVPVKADTSKIGQSLNKLQNKVVTAQVKAQGSSEVKTLQAAIDALKSKTVQAAARAQGAAGVRALNSEISALHDKIVTVIVRTINQTILQTLTAPAGGGPVSGTLAGGAPGMRITSGQTGFRVPGYGGGDIFPAMLEPGEAVVPKHLVSTLAPFLGAHNVPGFADGGFVGQQAYGPGAYWGMGSKMATWNPALMGVLQAAMNATQPHVPPYISGPIHANAIMASLAGAAGVSGGSSGGGSSATLAKIKAEISKAWKFLDQLYAEADKASGSRLASLKKEIHNFWKTTLDPLYAQKDALTGGRHGSGGSSGAFSGGWSQAQLAKIAREFTVHLSGDIAKEVKSSSAAKNIAAALINKLTQEVSYAKSVQSAMKQGLNLGGMDVTPGTGQGTVFEQMQSYSKSLSSFSGDLSKLGKGHLNKDLMKQIVAAGPVQGDALAQSILNDYGGIGAVNKEYAKITKQANKLGIKAAELQYGGHLSDNLRSGSVSSHGININVTLNKGTAGTLELTPEQVAAIVAKVQAALLKQAKKNNKTGVKLPGKSA